MGVVDDLADALAKDAIAIANAIGNDDVIYETAKILEATSATMQESYMTSVRVRLAERRAREFLAEKLPPDVDEI
jgi:hypothetical protein